MKVLVAGSGAMGASFGVQLLKAGNEVTFCDMWQEAVDAVNANGLYVTDVDKEEHFDVKYYLPQDVKGEFDLVLLFVKSYDLVKMVEAVKHLVQENTKVLCLLNGLGHYKTLKQYFSPKQVVMGVTVVTAKLLGPGRYLLSSHSPTEVSSMDPESRPAVEKVVDMFNEATMPFKYSENATWSMWRKACLNGTVNSVCALTNSTLRQEGEFPEREQLVYQLCKEFTQAAKLEGVELDLQEMVDYVTSFLMPTFAGCNHYPSMHQDLVTNKRLTEVDYLNGYVAKVCKEAGLWAPYCEVVTMFVHGCEKTMGLR